MPPSIPEEKTEKVSRFPVLAIVLVFLTLAIIPFIEFDENGTPILSTWRKEKLVKELENLDEAEQYALLATDNGYYPCLSCKTSRVDSTRIFLFRNEVWKYGTTTKGEKGRYRKTLASMNLKYQSQFVGTLADCLKQEKIKIYNYPLLPESLKRNFHLIRPPGNKQDN